MTVRYRSDWKSFLACWVDESSLHEKPVYRWSFVDHRGRIILTTVGYTSIDKNFKDDIEIYGIEMLGLESDFLEKIDLVGLIPSAYKNIPKLTTDLEPYLPDHLRNVEINMRPFTDQELAKVRG